MRLVWDPSAWEDYKHWQTADRRILKRINTLIDACLREPLSGIGFPASGNLSNSNTVRPEHGRGASPTSIASSISLMVMI